VLPAIDFNDEMRFLAAKIDDEASERHLLSKFQSLEPPVAHAKP
jgi:hypothetical protein